MSSNGSRRGKTYPAYQRGGAGLPWLARRTSVRPRRTARFGLWMLLAVAAILSAGCGLLAQQTEAPRPSASIPAFMKQPRPGNGVIGP
jgi:hypothetical protein